METMDIASPQSQKNAGLEEHDLVILATAQDRPSRPGPLPHSDNA